MRVYIAAVAASTLAVTSATHSTTQSTTPLATNWFNNLQDLVEEYPDFYDAAQQMIFIVMGGQESEFTTSIPFGTVDGQSASGNCNSNECLGSSCYDWALVDGLDRDIKSVASPTVNALLEESIRNSFLVGSSSPADVIQSVQGIIDNDDLVDFYETLETFACCDCEGCMSFPVCFQTLELPNVGGNFTCETIWSQIYPNVATEEELVTALDTLNVGGCYYCHDLAVSLPQDILSMFSTYPFPMPPGSTTTVPQHVSVTDTTTYTTTTTTEYECVAQNYQVNRFGDDELLGDSTFYNCDDIINLYALSDDTERFTCEDLESLYGLDCSGCHCAYTTEATTTTTTNLCYSDSASCLGMLYPMSCDALISVSEETIVDDPTFATLTCASLESLGCDCTGCACEGPNRCTSGKSSNGDILCMGGQTCDYWINHLPGMTCDILQDEYGCNCDYCDCQNTVTTPEPAPECKCEQSYIMDGANVTCDSMSNSIDGGLCCGVMEYAFQMDCTGCCCDAPTCETCTENTTMQTTHITSTSLFCPPSDTYYQSDPDCLFDYTCRTDEPIQRTKLFSRSYSCFWIQNYLDTNGEICFPDTYTPTGGCTQDDECDDTAVCKSGVCNICTDTIPGSRSETSTDAPCYYNDTYTAYDCVDDHLSGKGCPYFDESGMEKTQSYCNIELSDIDCPNAPEECNTACIPEYIAKGGCSASCGSGTRVLEYTCPTTQNGISCENNCVSQGIIPVGDIQVANCNTDACDDGICDDGRVGDGYCDWTDLADYLTTFNDDSSEPAYDFNVDICDWDGGDCCAYSCEHDDPTSPTSEWMAFSSRGQVCQLGGGGCQRVQDSWVNDLDSTSNFIMPGSNGVAGSVKCDDNNDGTHNCCLDVVLYDDSSSIASYDCPYDNLSKRCATQANHCIDPNGFAFSSTISSSSSSSSSSESNN
jgi:hypothetical protein